MENTCRQQPRTYRAYVVLAAMNLVTIVAAPLLTAHMTDQEPCVTPDEVERRVVDLLHALVLEKGEFSNVA